MQTLVISCGSPNGNSEILLKTALLAAASSSPTITTSLVSLQSLSLPSHAMPNHLEQSLDLALTSIPDDCPALLDAILLADALIISCPIYTRQPAGRLKAFTDMALGPFVDAAFVSRALKQNAAGIPRFKDYVKDYVPDERVLKNRVVGLIAVGGAIGTEWGSLALPGLQQSIFSLHAKVVDQVIIRGCPFPGESSFTSKKIGKSLSLTLSTEYQKKIANSITNHSVLIEGVEAINLAKRVGRSVTSGIGKGYDEATYLGEEGSCPYCHLDLVVLEGKGSNACECGVCGAKGILETYGEGRIKAVFEENSGTRVVTWKGKDNHMEEIEKTGKILRPKMDGAFDKREEFGKMEFEKVDFPSQRGDQKWIALFKDATPQNF
ncbi:uncharacterized protein LY89DRAFT_742299 [Mollisia scopiformis]|uniref:NADPH-dependent FMN reductase-like domain-containing protein n=1 Tax=Mollisia scopiformis TaxID=149040 RepID=A0A132B6Y7_MOLSC|nr:uncharacterized protein LY89DRAFT_742299 [Mollisia scopiformis]KUJ08003.1 hypothetical protein LY89DRAFT_742299 [Mollisia scopiformis]